MARNRVTVRGVQLISKKIGQVEGALKSELKNALQESLQDGVDEGHRVIGSSGTGRTWVANWDRMANAFPGRRASSPGRVASGNMLDRFTFTMSPDTKNRIRGRVGWPGRIGKDRYMLAQDQGFVHHITKHRIEGMQAVRAAQNRTDEAFLERAERVARNIARFNF